MEEAIMIAWEFANENGDKAFLSIPSTYTTEEASILLLTEILDDCNVADRIPMHGVVTNTSTGESYNIKAMGIVEVEVYRDVQIVCVEPVEENENERDAAGEHPDQIQLDEVISARERMALK